MAAVDVPPVAMTGSRRMAREEAGDDDEESGEWYGRLL
jgi:hypothetical protein